MKLVQNSDKEETDSLLLAASEFYKCNATTCRPEPSTHMHAATPTLLPHPTDPGIACGHNRIHGGTWHLSVIDATFLTDQISELSRATV